MIASPRGRALIVVLTTMIGVVAVACSGTGATPSSTLGPVPDGVAADLSVEVGQGRTQYADREILLEVTNSSDETMTLLSGALQADGFGPSRPAKDGRTIALRPGTTRDVHVGLGEAECAGFPAGPDEPVPDATPSATITLALGEYDDLGPATDVVVDEVGDPAGHLARNHAVDCAQAAVEAGAQLAVDADIPVETRGGELTALVTVRVEPVDGGPEVTIDRLAGTTLMANPNPRRGTSGWSGRDLAARSAGEITFPVVPARCDAHAVGEDKRGTFVPVYASVDGTPQHVFYLPMPDAARADLFAYIADYCDWPE
ncbi:hypothetical protein [Promicromonospora soli]|uniref:Uncharacterized protein n=1 Tax=Promicromonospora soli TaxID=2035533 RepID=A0A919FRS0_9MICO|nr:hypothetical protein [Promicromonospora soli]GHH70549.1 hypothetical protein GCM10017772_17350 [Promicromonospora soli]